jgi:hypothetical protein
MQSTNDHMEVSIMQRTWCSTSAGVILALIGWLTAGIERASAASPCPTPAAIETALRYPVKAVPIAVDGCLYELTGRYRGVMVSLLYQPATRANDVFADIKTKVKAKGKGAEPDRLSVGEGGWGYSSRGKKEAAAVSQGRLYHVEIAHNLFESLKLPDDAALRVIELGMRAAPGSTTTASSGGSKGGAPLDACTLASNAEVSQIAEERPEIAKYWSAPTASFGGSHCDYDGGSIRVYQGKAPAADLEAMLKNFAAKAPRTPVQGIGDKAFFMVPNPNDPYKRLGLLAVYAGPRVVQLTLDANGEEPIEATRPRLEKLARLVVPRLH